MSDKPVRAAREPLAVIGSRALQRDTKDVMDRVEEGESMVILRHGRPVAALVPIDREQAEVLALVGSPGFARPNSAVREPPASDERTFAVLSEPLQRQPSLGGTAAPRERGEGLMEALQVALESVRSRSGTPGEAELPAGVAKREILDTVISHTAESARALRELSTALDRESAALAVAFGGELDVEAGAPDATQAAES